MITPSFALTATERVLPKLALDFTTALLDSRIAFTRTTSASNPATYINSSGLVTSASNNQPRFDYDPVTLACKGLLIEESRTNKVFYSSSLNLWSHSSNFTRTGNYTTSPDGTANATRMLATGAAFSYDSSSAQVNGTTYTLSMWAKRNDAGSQAFGFFRNGTGTVDSPVALTSQWQRFNYTYTASGTSFAGVAAASGADVSVFGFQMEVGAFATSYIPTTTTALTRNADVATMTGTNFSDWFNATEGALQINATAISASQFISAGSIYLDNNNYITFGFGDPNKPRLLVRNAGTFEVNTTASVAQTSPFNQCVAYKASSISFASNTTLIVNSVNKAIPSGLDTLRIGANPAIANAYANAWLTKINYWPQRLINNEVIAFSK